MRALPGRRRFTRPDRLALLENDRVHVDYHPSATYWHGTRIVTHVTKNGDAYTLELADGGTATVPADQPMTIDHSTKVKNHD